MVSQNAIPSKQHLGGAQPFVFTEFGVLQLANVLRSEPPNHMSIRIIEIFVHLREMVMTHKDILVKLEKPESKVSEHDEEIRMLFTYLKKLLNPYSPPRTPIGYKFESESHE